MKTISRILLAALLGLSLATSAQADSHTPAVVLSLQQGLHTILSRVTPSIVNISVQGQVDAPQGDDEPKPIRPDGKHVKPKKFTALGSGVIMDAKNGFIITNAHVIRNADTVTVNLNDGRRLKAKVIGADPVTDIAVLKVKANHLNAITVGNSDNVKVGDFAVAIGNPFGLHNFGGTNQTATFGIVSALQRSDLNIEGVEDFIQTDAAINPGNSGGALINMNGQLIGINTAIISPYGGNIGIGFAIPVNMAKSIMLQLIKYGKIRRGLMGVFVQQLNPELAKAFNLPSTHGALVTQVNTHSPAHRAGLRAGDVITQINGAHVKNSIQVKNIISLVRVGGAVSMQVIRNGKTIRLDTTITDQKQAMKQLQTQNPYLFGLGLRDFDQTLPVQGHIRGIQIIGASENSAGWRSGLRPGDVILSANQTRVKHINELVNAAQKAKHELLVHIIRGPGSLYILIK